MCRRQPGIGMSFVFLVCVHCLLKRGIVKLLAVYAKSAMGNGT